MPATWMIVNKLHAWIACTGFFFCAEAFLSQTTATAFNRSRGSTKEFWTRHGRRCDRPRSHHPFDMLSLGMSLVPLETSELKELIAVGAPTGIQYSTYWGRTDREKYGRGVESALVSIIGMCFSYFMSFVLGGFVATLLGSLFLFWGILSPELKAYQRNWEFLGGRELVDEADVMDRRIDPDRAGLYGALFFGYVRDVCVVEDTSSESYEYSLDEFVGYTANSDELEKYTGNPYLLRVLIADRKGREMQVHARLMEEYLEVDLGMPVTGILLSTTPRFDRLAAITDLFVPEASCYIGDYPYLNRAEIEEMFVLDNDLWRQFQAEGYPDENDADKNDF